MARKKRILFGAVDIGYRIKHYSQFIEENFSEQLEAESFSKFVLPQTHFHTKYTYKCEIYKENKIYIYFYMFFFFIYSLLRYDVFHFLSGELILTRKLRKFEMWTYKKLGKKIIMHFVGADIRSLKYLDWKSENIEAYLNGKENPYPNTEDYQNRLIDDTLKYADVIIVSTPDLLDILPKAIYLPVFLNPNDLKEDNSSSKEEKSIRILFSPSSHRTKGSKYIHEAIMNIKKTNNDIEVILPGKKLSDDKFYAMTRYELLNTFKNVDIVIDQMIIGWYGLKTVEALYNGCDVICFIDEKCKKYIFNNCPIVCSNVIELENSIQKLIEEKRKKKQKINNKEWVEKHHFITSYKNELKQIWLN